MEEEIKELLGRRKSERQAAVDGEGGYRNGHGKRRRLAMTAGTITVRRPRVRGLEVRVESRLLPLFAKKVANAEALVWKILMLGEKRFRRLNAPELLEDVHAGNKFVDGVAVSKLTRRRAA